MQTPFKGKPKSDRYMEPDEFKQLLRATDDSDSFKILLLLGTTGMRTIETTWIRVGDLDIRNGGFHKKIAKQGAKRKKKPENGEKPTKPKKDVVRKHFIKVSPDLLQALNAWAGGRGPNEPLVLYRGQPVTRRQIRYIFHKYKEKAGIRPCLGPHSMRHLHGIVLTEHGFTPQQVAQRLGHKTLNMVLEYADLRGEVNEEMAAVAGASVGKDLMRRGARK